MNKKAVSIRGKAVNIGSEKLKEVFEQNPYMAEIYPQEKESCFEQGDLLVDYEKRRVEVGGTEVHLTPIEYKILNLLIANRGKVLTHHYILKEIWGYAEGVEAGTLRVFMATLRRKIEKNPSDPQHIITEVGVGYRFK